MPASHAVDGGVTRFASRASQPPAACTRAMYRGLPRLPMPVSSRGRYSGRAAGKSSVRAARAFSGSGGTSAGQSFSNALPSFFQNLSGGSPS